MRRITPDAIRPPFAHYAHGVEVRAGARMLFSSGQLGLAPDDALPGGAEAQAARCFANLDAILSEAGMTRADVVRLNAFVTDRAHMAGYMAARDAWVAALAEPPASTLMIVSGFTRPEFLVEIEMVAAAE
ncbi:RidA family protein [Rhodovulum sp. DZ06]|uniref:RidA family protein n=1 Tax=Rhodovulum sp. DZ06 TaxID=3425126 RepID=UPI003D341545